jgi:hypothetical protein
VSCCCVVAVVIFSGCCCPNAENGVAISRIPVKRIAASSNNNDGSCLTMAHHKKLLLFISCTIRHYQSQIGIFPKTCFQEFIKDENRN